MLVNRPVLIFTRCTAHCTVISPQAVNAAAFGWAVNLCLDNGGWAYSTPSWITLSMVPSSSTVHSTTIIPSCGPSARSPWS